MGLFFGLLVLFVVAMLGLSTLQQHLGREMRHVGDFLGVAVFVAVVVAGYSYRSRMAKAYRHNVGEKVHIDVKGDRLTVSERPGEVFSLRGAQVGPWAYWASAGSALHLRCGARRFVLGGRDHRVASGTRVEAPAVRDVDAWLWAEDFDALLEMGGLRQGPAEREPDAGEPARSESPAGTSIRCLLLPNPELLARQRSPFRGIGNTFETPSHATLAIDLGTDHIRVIDPTTNTVRASSRLGQVTASPAVFVPAPKSITRLSSDTYLKRRWGMTPVLELQVPGLEPVNISCRDDGSSILTGQSA